MTGHAHPSRALDAEIAEKVMGWTDVSLTAPRRMPNGVTWFVPCGYSPENRCHVELPEYSSDIAAAWEVVEHLKSRGWAIRLSNKMVDWCWWAYVYDYRSEHAAAEATVQEDTAPMAICLAALKAIDAIPPSPTAGR